MEQQTRRSILTRYRRATLNTPVVHFVGELLAGFVSLLFWIRWQLSRPFQTRLLPKSAPRITVYGLEGLTYLTYGEILLSLPLLFLSFAAYYYCFVDPDVDASGNVSSYFLIYGFMLANKSSSIFSLVLGIPFERLILYHKITAVLALVIGIIHTVIAFDIGRDNVSPAAFAVETVTNTLGTLIVICLTGFVATSLFPFFRRRFYDAWLFTHVGFIVATALPWACHSVNMVWLPLFWWALDLSVRYVIMARCYYARSATLRLLRPNVVEVKFPKPRAFQYNPGQFVRICIPQITSYQFHPFSLSSAPHEKYVTLHIRGLGNWTKNLVKLACSGADAGKEPVTVEMFMEGPYGSLSMDLDNPRYGMVLCVSGGIGVTHCRSVARSVLHDHAQHVRSMEQVRFIWAVRHHDLVEDLPPFEVSAQPDLEKGEYKVSVTVDDQQQDGAATVDVECSTSEDDGDTADTSLLVKSPIRAEVYLTVKKGQGLKQSASEEKSNSDNSCEKNTKSTSVHDQQMVVINGRPDLDRIVNEMKEEALQKGITHIAAFGCGPKPLIDALRETCRKHSQGVFEPKGVTIDLHVETFEF